MPFSDPTSFSFQRDNGSLSRGQNCNHGKNNKNSFSLHTQDFHIPDISRYFLFRKNGIVPLLGFPRNLQSISGQGVCSLEALNGYGDLEEEKYSTEETVLCKLYEAKVREGIAQLAKEDARLIYLLFFEEVTIKDAAQIMGCSRKTIYNRRKRILSELRSILHDLGIVGGAF